MPGKRRVLIVDDHPVFRMGLATLIDKQSDMEVGSQVATVPDAIAAITCKSPDVVVLDLSLEGASGLELLQRLRDIDREIPVLVVSLHDEHIYASRALRAGARGYVMKREPPEHMVQQIRRVLAGDIAVSAEVANLLLVETASQGAPVQDPVTTLTNREFEVFQLIGRAVPTSKTFARTI